MKLKVKYSSSSFKIAFTPLDINTYEEVRYITTENGETIYDRSIHQIYTVKRKSDNVIGTYNLQTDTFTEYTNSTAGPTNYTFDLFDAGR